MSQRLPLSPGLPKTPGCPQGSPHPQGSLCPHLTAPPAPPLSPAGISSVLFASRLGCLRQEVPRDTEAFIRAIGTMFGMTLLTMAMPKALHRLFPKPWRTFCEAWDFMFAFGEGAPGAGGGHTHTVASPKPPRGCLRGFVIPPPCSQAPR